MSFDDDSDEDPDLLRKGDPSQRPIEPVPISTSRAEDMKSLLIKRLKGIAKQKKLQELIRRAGKDKKYIGDAPFVPCSPEVGGVLCDGLEIGADDFVVDLGCGHGDVLIEAAKRGAKCFGVEINEKVFNKGKAKVAAEGVTESVELFKGDFRDEIVASKLKEATVVYVYLLPKNLEFIVELISKSIQDGIRICSYTFPLRKGENYYSPSSVLQVKSPVKSKPGYGLTHLYVYKAPLLESQLGYKPPANAYQFFNEEKKED